MTVKEATPNAAAERLRCDKCGHSVDMHRNGTNGKRECDGCRCRRTQWYIAKLAQESAPTDEDRTAATAYGMGYREGRRATVERIREWANKHERYGILSYPASQRLRAILDEEAAR